MRQDSQQKFDIVLYGATSFVGKITARYLANFVKGSNLKIAIAGRNKNKLTDIFNQINNPNIHTILADSNDPNSLDEMTCQTKVIISTVGPYSNYGEPLVASCVKNGTDYVDLCGEMTFVKAMIDKYNDIAKQTGARIVNSCGFDSLPSDLGVHYLQQHAKANFNKPCRNVSLKVKAAKGGMSGGTLASMMVVMEQAHADPNIFKQVIDPYVLIPETCKPSVKQIVHTKASFDQTHQKWQTPFIMDPTNSRVVHRSNYLSYFSYGKDFRYEELMWFPNRLKGKIMAKAVATVIHKFEKAAGNQRWKNLLKNHILPKPGAGPSVKAQESGYFDFRFYGYEDDEARVNNQTMLVTKVTGQKDPGYGATAMMLSQAALCLALDVSKKELSGGFWSPAYAMGDKLITRLSDHAMMTFEVLQQNQA